ncbi:MAG: hypothetical protein ACK5LY_10395 [Lachnospirales bacterium]
MKRLIIGTFTVTMVLSTVVYGKETDTMEIMPVNTNIEESDVIETTISVTESVSPAIGILPIETVETNNVVLSYKPVAPNENVVITSIDGEGNFDSCLNLWEVSYVGSEDKSAVIGYIEEYSSASIDTLEINTDLYEVFETENYVYIASVNSSKVLYYPENTVDALTFSSYQEDLINFLQPYQLSTDVAIQGINSNFTLSLPDEFDLNAYNVDTYNDNYIDAISFMYQPMNRMDMPQEVFKIVVSDEELGEEFVKVLDAKDDIYIFK